MNKINKYLIHLVFVAFITSCSSVDIKNTDYNQLNQRLSKESIILFNKEKTPTLIKVQSSDNKTLNSIVNVVSASPLNIIEAINLANSTLSVLPDRGINLDKELFVNFKKNTFKNYLSYLEVISGYNIRLNENNTVEVKSVVSKTYDLQTLSLSPVSIETSAKSEVSSDGSAPTLQTINTSDKWNAIVSQIDNIMQSTLDYQNGSPNNQSNQSNLGGVNKKYIVSSNQQLGVVSVIGSPVQIRKVDSWVNNLITSSNRQVHLQVQVLDVSIDKSIGQGINWNLISKQSSGLEIGNNSEQVIDGAGLLKLGTPQGAAIDFGKKITLDLMLNLLKKQGKVKVNNQPNITTTNGVEASISTGDEFSYVAKINSTPDTNGNVVTTSEIERMSVGVDLRVVPKILPDNRIVLSILPVVSSLKSYTTLTSGSGASLQEFKTPNIALQKLATQVIVENGQTIHLGGLIASKIADASKGIPNGGMLNWLFEGVQKTFERREIVILITPTIVN